MRIVIGLLWGALAAVGLLGVFACVGLGLLFYDLAFWLMFWLGMYGLIKLKRRSAGWMLTLFMPGVGSLIAAVLVPYSLWYGLVLIPFWLLGLLTIPCLRDRARAEAFEVVEPVRGILAAPLPATTRRPAVTSVILKPIRYRLTDMLVGVVFLGLWTLGAAGEYALYWMLRTTFDQGIAHVVTDQEYESVRRQYALAPDPIVYYDADTFPPFYTPTVPGVRFERLPAPNDGKYYLTIAFGELLVPETTFWQRVEANTYRRAASGQVPSVVYLLGRSDQREDKQCHAMFTVFDYPLMRQGIFAKSAGYVMRHASGGDASVAVDVDVEVAWGDAK